jgi:hypothetical protein
VREAENKATQEEKLQGAKAGSEGA